MTRLFWILQLLVIVLCSGSYLIVRLGDESRLGSGFLRDKVYETARLINGPYVNLKFVSRGTRKLESKIVIVDIDEKALSQFGRWPWRRVMLGELSQQLMKFGVKVIGYDMAFPESEKVLEDGLRGQFKGPEFEKLFGLIETDFEFEKVLKLYPNNLVLGFASDSMCRPTDLDRSICNPGDPEIIKAIPEDFQKFALKDFNKPPNFDTNKVTTFAMQSVINNIPEFSKAVNYSGSFNTSHDPDGFVRRIAPFFVLGDKLYPALSVAMYQAGEMDDPVITMSDRFEITEMKFKESKKSIPVNRRGDILINFAGGQESFPFVSVADLFVEDPNKIPVQISGKISEASAKDLFQDAYVFLGTSAQGLKDLRNFPFGTNLPGVLGHANLLENLISGKFLVSEKPKTYFLFFACMIMVGIIYGFIFLNIKALPLILISFSSYLVLAYIDIKVLFANNYNWDLSYTYVQVFLMTAVTLGVKYLAEEKEKRFISDAFGKYVSPAVVSQIVKDPKKLSLGGEKKELSIMFSDIRGFTTISEKLDARQLSQLLNEYLGKMTNIIVDDNKGTLDKYIGDAIMAFWGAPMPSRTHAADALKAAVSMQQTLAAQKGDLKKKYGVDINVGVGINSGSVSVGNMGSSKNFSYTVLGDHVNLASRLEGLTKHYGAGILTSGFTIEALKASGETVPAHRIIDNVKVKGKNEAVQLVEVFYQEMPKDFLNAFEEARGLYMGRKWDLAIKAFGSALQTFQQYSVKANGPLEDAACKLFVERSEYFKAHPPDDAWQGEWVMKEK